LSRRVLRTDRRCAEIGLAHVGKPRAAAMLRRSLRTRGRVGAAARRRIQQGGPRATGRPAASLEEWAVIRRIVFRRARWRCQACGRGGAVEVHHVVKRAQGARTSISGLRSRPPGGALPAMPRPDGCPLRSGPAGHLLGGGRFTCEVTSGADKWAIRAEPRAGEPWAVAFAWPPCWTSCRTSGLSTAGPSSVDRSA
jgi:hypothetical protein